MTAGDGAGGESGDRCGPAAVRRPLAATLAVTALALLLYLPWLSRHYNPNGITEAIAVENGGPGLFTPNHLLFRPLGAATWHALLALGCDGRAVVALQGVSAVTGALGVGLLFLACARMSGRRDVALVAALWVATSTSYWSCSVDAIYILPAAAAVAGALAAVTAPGLPPLARAATAGLCLGLATLSWEACVLLVPAFAGGVASLDRGRPPRHRLAVAAVLAAVSLGSAGAVYLGVGVAVLGHRSPAEVLGWVTGYAGVHLPQWGRWGLDRLLSALGSAVASLAPVNPATRPGELLQGLRGVEAILGRVALAALLVLAVASLAALLAGSGRRQRLAGLGWVAAAHASLALFVVWWEPYQPKWFAVLNLFLAAGLAVVWARAARPRLVLGVAALCMAVTATATFATRTWPRRTRPPLDLERAACVGSHMADGDLFVAIDWRMVSPLRYFHRARVVSVVGETDGAGDPRLLFARLRAQVEGTLAAGGAVYMPDPRGYRQGFWRWFTPQTGLTRVDLERFEGRPAIECGGMTVVRVERVR